MGDKPVADFYGRKSSKDDGRSVASQEDEFRADCAEQGFAIGRLFADPDRSASRYARKPRPDFNALVEHIRAGHCEILSMWESSRGSRDEIEWFTLLRLCRQQGVLIRIISHDRTYDLQRRRDWRTLADDGLDAADESEKIAERTRRGKRAAAVAGRPAGKVPYGYRREYVRVEGKARLEIRQVEHPEEAAVVREIAGAVCAGESNASIARRLNERGVPSPAGGRWTGGHLAVLVTNPRYVAKRVHRGEIVGPADWPAILTEEQYRTCVAILKDPARVVHRGTALKWPLAGLMRCGRCETGILRTALGNGARSYQCESCRKLAIKADPLDKFVIELVHARLEREDAAPLFASAADNAALEAARAEEARLADRLAELRAEAAKPDGLSAATLAMAERELVPRLEAASRRVRELERPPALRDLVGVDIRSRWPSFTPTRQREILRAVVELWVDPAVRGRGYFDPYRLGRSRWVGDDRTWTDIWAERGLGQAS